MVLDFKVNTKIGCRDDNQFFFVAFSDCITISRTIDQEGSWRIRLAPVILPDDIFSIKLVVGRDYLELGATVDLVGGFLIFRT